MLLCGTTAHSADDSTILVFGDSLSAGYGIGVDNSWVSLLQARLGSLGYEHRVVNASISGETTEGAVARIDQALQRFQPELIILELGANDAFGGFTANAGVDRTVFEPFLISDMQKSLFLLLVLLCGTTAHSADDSTILVFGDSLSAGYGIGVDNSWVSLLQARLGSLGYEHRVVNASISGETTEGAVARIDQAL